MQYKKDGAKLGVAMAAVAEPMVRIRLPPAESQQTFGSARDFREKASVT
jgi:hypothetical protein